jgi:hypothetical protein
MAENQTSKDRLRDITESIETGIKDLFQSDKYAQYLRTMSRFHKYSVNNTILIFMQRPDATLSRVQKWIDSRRNVMKAKRVARLSRYACSKRKSKKQSLTRILAFPYLTRMVESSQRTRK